MGFRSSHDDLARIASGNCGSVWSQTFTYDAFGNLTKAGSESFSPGYKTIDSVTVTYDALGRMVEQSNSGTNTEIQYAPTGFKMQTFNGQTVTDSFVPLPGGTAGDPG